MLCSQLLSCYFLKKEADYFLSTTIATSSRAQKVDFPASFAYAPYYVFALSERDFGFGSIP